MASSPVISLIIGTGRIERAHEAALVRSESWDEESHVAFSHDREPLS
jgi:hypothetical protein